MPGIKNKLFYNFFSLGVVQLITSLLQLIVIPYVISRIGVDGFGVVAVAQVVMFYLSSFTEYGFNQTATREISIQRNDQPVISAIFSRVIFSRLLLCSISLMILLILLALVPVFREHSILYLSGFIFVAGQSVLCNWFLMGVEKMQLMAIINLVARLIFVALVFIFLKSKNDDVLYLFFLGIGNLIMGLFSLFLIKRKYSLKLFIPAFKDISEELRKGWQITATNLLISICQYSNIFILRLFTNDLITGYYGIAERVFLTVRQMPGVFSQTIYPQVCLTVIKGKQAVVSLFRKTYVPFLAALTAGSVLMFFFSPWVLYFFIRHENSDSVLLLRIFAFTLIIVCLNIPATLLLLAADRQKSYFTIYTAGVVLNILLNLLLAHFFGSKGTAVAILSTELFITIGLTRELFVAGILKKEQLIQNTEAG